MYITRLTAVEQYHNTTQMYKLFFFIISRYKINKENAWLEEKEQKEK